VTDEFKVVDYPHETPRVLSLLHLFVLVSLIASDPIVGRDGSKWSRYCGFFVPEGLEKEAQDEEKEPTRRRT
jgi:hypothetical protein